MLRGRLKRPGLRLRGLPQGKAQQTGQGGAAPTDATDRDGLAFTDGLGPPA